MNTDDWILLCGYLLLGVVVAALAARRRNKAKTILSHLVTLVLYSTPLLYGLFALSKEGDALAWWFYLLLALGVHSLVALILLVKGPYTRPRTI